MMWHRRTAHHGKKKTDKAEMQISDTENDGTSPDISTDKAIAAGDTTAITLYAIWEKASEYKITYKLNKGKIILLIPKLILQKMRLNLKSRRVPDIILWDGIQTVSIKSDKCD